MTLTTLATIIMIVMVSFTAHGDEPLQADSLPQTWSYTPDTYQEIPGGPEDKWWSRFSDPLLDSLIVLGVERNYDLRIAHRRQEIARAAMNQTRAGWFPTIGLSAGWTAAKESGATTRGASTSIPTESYFNAGLSASWEIDIFGKVAAGVKEKKAQYNATRAEYAGSMVSLTAPDSLYLFHPPMPATPAPGCPCPLREPDEDSQHRPRTIRGHPRLETRRGRGMADLLLHSRLHSDA